MTKVYYEIENVSNTSISNLEKTINYLKNAKDRISSAPKPSFPLIGYVNSLPSIINTHINDCKKTKSWLEDCSSKFSKFNDETISTFNKFVVNDIKEKPEQVGII